MQKISIILLLAWLITGCSAGRFGQNLKNEGQGAKSGSRVLEQALNQNVTGSGFFIQKAEVEVSGDGGSEKFITNIRFRYPDSYIISIRNRTGIEAARIFIGSDTIMVNDRINRTLYCASPGYIKSKYGFSLAVLPVLLGDYIGNRIGKNEVPECINGELYSENVINGFKINYTLDCGKGKAVMMKGEGSTPGESVVVKCEEFYKVSGKFIPGMVSMSDKNTGNEIIIRIQKILIPWDGDIEFVPGNRYEIINLL